MIENLGISTLGRVPQPIVGIDNELRSGSSHFLFVRRQMVPEVRIDTTVKFFHFAQIVYTTYCGTHMTIYF